MTKVKIIKTDPGINYLPIGKQGTYPKGEVVDVSGVDPAEVKLLLDGQYIEIVPEASAASPGNSGDSGC